MTNYSYNSNGGTSMGGGWTTSNSNNVAIATETNPSALNSFPENKATVTQQTPIIESVAPQPVLETASPVIDPQLQADLTNATIETQAPVALVDTSGGTVKPHPESKSFMNKVGSFLKKALPKNALSGIVIGGAAGSTAGGGIPGAIVGAVFWGSLGLMNQLGVFGKNKESMNIAAKAPDAPMQKRTMKQSL